MIKIAGALPRPIHERLPDGKRPSRPRLRRLLLCRGNRLSARRSARRRRPVPTGLFPGASPLSFLFVRVPLISSVHRVRARRPTYSCVSACPPVTRAGHTISSGAGGPHTQRSTACQAVTIGRQGWPVPGRASSRRRRRLPGRGGGLSVYCTPRLHTTKTTFTSSRATLTYARPRSRRPFSVARSNIRRHFPPDRTAPCAAPRWVEDGCLPGVFAWAAF
jgi:hypothetical protein